MFNPNEYIANKNNWTYEDLVPYHEQHVAWSMDGKQILASAPTIDELFQRIEQGLKEYVLGFVPDPNISEMGGALLNQDWEPVE